MHHGLPVAELKPASNDHCSGPCPVACTAQKPIRASDAHFEATAWFGLMAPAGTPPAIIDRLHREAARVLALGELGMEVVANTPAEFAGVIRTETEQWAQLIRDAGIKPAD